MTGFGKNLFYMLLVCLFSLSANAQTYKCAGKVIDNSSKEGVPFCSVFLKDSNIGTYSDENGFFELEADFSFDKIYITSIGYEEQVVNIDVHDPKSLNISLIPISHVLMTAVVYAGENPAHPIIKKVIANKKDNQFPFQQDKSWKEYTKVEVDLEGIKKPKKKGNIVGSFDYAFEHIDSTSEESPFLPVYFNETLADVYFNKIGDKFQKEFTANKASGLDNESVILFVNDFQEDYNIYENWINVFDKPFAGPFAKGAFHYYKFYLTDSLYQDQEKFYKIKFKPKRKQENAFKGYCLVSAESYAVQDIKMSMPDDININFVEKIDIAQSFQKIEERWLPYQQETRIQVKPAKKMPGMIGRKTCIQYDLKSLAVSPKPSAKNEEHLLEKDDQFWRESRPIQLSTAEEGIYTMVDSIQNIKMYKTISEIIKVAFVGTKEIGPFEIGPYFSLTSNNVLEGQRFKFGAWTSNAFSDKVKIGGFAAYGLRDQRFKYGGDMKWIINRSPRLVFGMSYKNDNDLNSDADFEVGEGNMLASFFRRDITQKLILDKKTKLYLEKYWPNGFYSRFSFMHYDMDPVGNLMSDGSGFNFAYQKDGNYDSPVDTTVTTAEFALDIRYAFKEKHIDTGFDRTSMGSKYPILHFNLSVGTKGILGSEYDYQRMSLSLKQSLKLNPLGEFSYLIEGGKTFGQVPFLLSNVHRGNETYFLMGAAFNTMNRYEFASDEYISVKLEHHFDGFILNRIPLIRKLKWRTVASFKAVKGKLSAENLASNQMSLYDPNNTKFIGVRAPSEQPYMETSLGIENILKVFRVDALWRLNYLDNPESIPFMIKVGMNLRF